MIAKITLFLLFLLLIWGNLVAGLKAGLACPDWPLCHGTVLPPFRWDIYMEFMHRIIGGVTSLFLVILSYQRFRAYRGYVKLVPVIILLLLLAQIVLGGIVVLLELPVDLTTYHFANAIVIFALTLYISFYDGNKRKPRFSIDGYKGLFFFLGLLVFVQAVLGAYVRHSGSGLACPDFPTCLGYWIPPELSGIILNHFVHRVVAYIITITVIVLLLSSYMAKGLRMFRKELLILICLIILQIALGVGVVQTRINFAVTALHLSIALLILSLV
ncbi:MAG TPA: COX15/CtaA family protein, partial [Thermodesulfobacteriota bacterium]|nr:COX15/CtaA family protein [Thermodesulfobacteriota bacterium]